MSAVHTIYDSLNIEEDISANGNLLFKGNTNESLRFTVDEDTNFTVIQKLIEGIWQPAQFEVSPSTLWVGRNVGIAALGHHLATEDAKGNLLFHAHSEFDGEVTIKDTQIIYAYGYFSDIPIQPDDSGEWTGTSLKFNMSPSTQTLLETFSVKTGSTAATEYVRLKVREDDPDTGPIILDQKYPAGDFIADTIVDLSLVGNIEFTAGENFYFEYSSAENFSLKTNAGEMFPWARISYSLIREENLLQTQQWTNGTNFTEGQLLITDRQIYVSNTTGVQTGTWESNSDKWYDTGSKSEMNYWTKIANDLRYDGNVNISSFLNIEDGAISIYKSDDKPYIDFFDSGGSSQGRVYGYSNAIEIRSPNGASTYFKVDTGAGTTEMFDDAYVSYDFYVGEDLIVDTDALFVDSSENKIGIGTDEPVNELEVVGDINISGYYYGDGSQLTGMLWRNISGIATYDGSISVDGNLISQQSDGIYVGGVKLEENQWEVYNPGDDWTKKIGIGYWQDVAVSSTGRYQSTVAYDDPIMISSDYGQTWTNASGTDGPEWYGIAMSSDGKYQTAMALYNDIFISSDYGITWNDVDAGGGSWSNVDMSSDGKMQVGTKGGIGSEGPIYISYDYGNNWTNKSEDGYWQSVAMSSDGRYISAVEAGEKIYRSDDYGETWARIGGSGSLLIWDDIAMSSDGKYQTAVNQDDDEKIFVSSDYGLSFNWKGLTRSGYTVAMSSDGKIQVVGVSNYDPSDDFLYLSEDYGQTWTQIPDTSESIWMGTDMSSDGMFITSVADNDGVFVSQSDYQFAGDILIDGDLNVTGTTYSRGLSVDHETDENYNILEFQVYRDPLVFGNLDWNASGARVELDQSLIIDGGPHQRDFTIANGNLYLRRADEIPNLDFLDSTGTYVNARLRTGTLPYIFQITNGSNAISLEINTSSREVSIKGELNVSGESTFNDSVTINGNLNISGTATYAEDYYENYTDRTLVDKEYSDYGSILAKRVQTTGILYGGVVSRPTFTTLNWTAGEGQVVNYTNPANPEVTRVSWDEVTSYSPVNLGTPGQYLVAYDKNGDVVEIYVPDFNSEETREYIVIGGFSVFSGIIARISDSSVTIGYNGFNSFKDFARNVIGPANIDGNIISATGGGLSIDNSGGLVFIVGANFRNDPTITDERTVANASAIYYSRVLREASPSTAITADGAGIVNILDPTKYDDGSGTLATVTGNRFSVQTVYITPDGEYVVAYGQETFNTETAAEDAVRGGSISYEEYPLLLKFVRRAFIIIQSSETDLDNAVLISDGKFRGGGVTSGGVSVHSSLSKLEFDVSGHLFENGGELDIGNYNFTTNGTAIFTSGNVGIGTSTPFSPLHIVKDSEDLLQLTRDSDTEDGTAAAGILFGVRSVPSGLTIQNKGAVLFKRTGTHGRGDLVFAINNDTDNENAGLDDVIVTFKGGGNVGIGTASPTQKLDVNGSVNVSGSFTAEEIYLEGSGSDYIDWNPGDDWFRFSAGIDAPTLTVSGDLNGDHLTVSTADITDYLLTPIIRNTDGDTVTIEDKLDVDGDIYASSIGNPDGTFMIQPDANNDVELFYDDVADGETGRELKVWRRAPEGDNHIRMYISATQTGFIHTDVPLTLQSQVPFTINSVTDSIYFKVGDNDSVEKFHFRDSDNNDVVTIDSNGVMTLDKNNGAYLNLVRGTQNKISNFFDSTYTDLRFEGAKQENRIGTWIDEDFKIVTNSLPRVTIDNDGLVGIGKTPENYPLEILSTSPSILLENSRTIMGTGYGVGGLFFNAGEGTHENVAEIGVYATENWIANESSPTRMEFHTTPVNDTHTTSRMIINEAGRVSIGTMNTVEQLLHVDNSIKAEGAYFFNDGSTKGSAQDGFLGHISTAVFRNNFSTASQDSSPRDMHFKPDGTKVYISGVQGDGIVWEYDLSDPWNISSMVYNSNNFNVDTWESNPMGLFITPDGRIMYVSGSGGDEVNRFNLGTAWDVSSSTWNSLYDCSGEETAPSGLDFRPDGKKMYIVGDQHNDVTEYDLTEAWDITTSTPLQTFGTDIDAPTGITFKRDGTRMYIMDGSAEDDIHEFVLSTPWDISTAVLQELFDISSQNGVPQDIALSPDLTKVYMLGSTSPASLFEYDLGISAEGKIIGGGMPIYFTCGESGDLAPGAEWSCGGNGEVNQYVYLWDDVTATGMAMDCNTGAGTAIIRLETQSGGDTGCNLTSTGENAATTFSCDVDSGNWFRPYTVSNGGHEACVITIRFITR